MRMIISSWGEPVKRFGVHSIMVGGVMMAVASIALASPSEKEAVSHHHHHHKHKESTEEGGEKKASAAHKHKHHKKSHHFAHKVASGTVTQQALSAQPSSAKGEEVAQNSTPSAVPADARAAVPPLATQEQADASGLVLPEQESSDEGKGTETGLPLPRFAALRADRVYMRRGPGERYPIDWVYYRRGLPIQIEREFGVWRLIEDSEGQKGWVHQVTLRGIRNFVVLGDASSEEALAAKEAVGAAQPKPITHADSQIVGYVSSQKLQGNFKHDALLMSSVLSNHIVVAVLKPGTVGTIKECPEGSTWCRVTVRGCNGWLERRALWGVQPGEIIQPD